MPNQQLSYPEKLQLLSDLRNFYMEDFWMIYDDTPQELWRLKWVSIWLILDSVNTFFKWDYTPSKDELIFVLRIVLSEDFLNDIYKDKEEEEICFMKSWFWCAIGILLWDKDITKNEKDELEKTWWIIIKSKLL